MHINGIACSAVTGNVIRINFDVDCFCSQITDDACKLIIEKMYAKAVFFVNFFGILITPYPTPVASTAVNANRQLNDNKHRPRGLPLAYVGGAR